MVLSELSEDALDDERECPHVGMCITTTPVGNGGCVLLPLPVFISGMCSVFISL